VILDESLFVLMVKDPASVVAEMLYEVFPSSAVGPKVKETGVGIAFADVVDSGTLFFPLFFNNQPTDYAFLSLEWRLNSALESCRMSCASSRREITSWAMSSFCRAFERKDLLHFRSATAVEKSLCPRRWKGSVCDVGVFQACATIS
jgi:hypothetical protein